MRKCCISMIACVVLIMCSCSRKSSEAIDTRCPELVEMMEYSNLQYGDKEGPMGMRMSVEYIDSVYRMIDIVDESIIPPEKIGLFYGYMKSNSLASISAAKEKDRKLYQLMVDHHVWFEHVIKSKKSGEVIARTTLSPKDIAEALEHKLTPLDEIKTWINNIANNTLPREIEPGYTMTNIMYTDNTVKIEIVIDEDLKDFEEATKIRDWKRVDQAVTLADLTTGLTFHSIASSVPIGIKYHFVGSKNNNNLTISFSADEVVQYNEVMERIKKLHNNK